MWPDAVLMFNHSLGVQLVCLGCLWILINVDKKYFFKSENFEKNEIMISVIHYFITKFKTEIAVIPRSNFKFAIFWRYMASVDQSLTDKVLYNVY